jgi:hypothetical protein
MTKQKSLPELRGIAASLTGERWNPSIEVTHSRELNSGAKRGWYWRDRHEKPSDQYRGPFRSESAALADAINQYNPAALEARAVHSYTVSIEVQTERALTQRQQDTLRAEVLRVIDEEANLPLDADVTTATITKD